MRWLAQVLLMVSLVDHLQDRAFLAAAAIKINFNTNGKPKLAIKDPETGAQDEWIGPFQGTIRAVVDLPRGVDNIRIPLIYWTIDSWDGGEKAFIKFNGQEVWSRTRSRYNSCSGWKTASGPNPPSPWGRGHGVNLRCYHLLDLNFEVPCGGSQLTIDAGSEVTQEIQDESFGLSRVANLEAQGTSLSEWGDWSGCDKATGTQTRTRPLSRCSGNSQDVRKCGVDCEVANDGWSVCDKSKGEQTEILRVLVPAQNGGAACRAPGTRTCAVDCESENAGWEKACDQETGLQREMRRVTVAKLNGGKDCPSPGTRPCAVNCTVGPWGEWSSCAALDTSERSRQRSVTKLSMNGGGCVSLREKSPCEFSEEICIDGCPPQGDGAFLVRPISIWPGVNAGALLNASACHGREVSVGDKLASSGAGQCDAGRLFFNGGRTGMRQVFSGMPSFAAVNDAVLLYFIISESGSSYFIMEVSSTSLNSNNNFIVVDMRTVVPSAKVFTSGGASLIKSKSGFFRIRLNLGFGPGFVLGPLPTVDACVEMEVTESVGFSGGVFPVTVSSKGLSGLVGSEALLSGSGAALKLCSRSCAASTSEPSCSSGGPSTSPLPAGDNDDDDQSCAPFCEGSIAPPPGNEKIESKGAPVEKEEDDDGGNMTMIIIIASGCLLLVVFVLLVYCIRLGKKKRGSSAEGKAQSDSVNPMVQLADVSSYSGRRVTDAQGVVWEAYYSNDGRVYYSDGVNTKWDAPG